MMNLALLSVGLTCVLVWIGGIPVLWRLLRATPARPASLTGLTAEFLMLVHLLLLLVAVSMFVIGCGWAA
jgi:hypothetical protein